jgi:hypothetical protein
MVVFTADQQKQIMTHVLDNLITNTDPGKTFHEIKLFLDYLGIDDIEDLLFFTD